MTKILVIDDEIILRTEVTEWLTLEGYTAADAADGVQGIEFARRDLPDLIICDITMPKLDGYGVLLELRSDPATMNIPFIFVTARASYEDVRRGMDLGADDYITKPFTRLELLHAVQTRLYKKAAQEQNYHREVEQWQQAFEQERAQRQLKSKLIAMFSHDFRTPLTSIMSSNTFLRDYADRIDKSRQQTYFNRIESSVRQLTQMLDDMLMIAQMETNNLEYKPQPVNLDDFLRRIIEEFQMTHAKTHPIVLESRFMGSINADPRLLRQIAVNLISNAIKYSPQGGEVKIILERIASQVILTVQDRGIGIPLADQDRLFNAFQRASNVGEVRGTGLGLAIVKQAVDLHHGTIHLESEVSKGTRITIQIPA